MEMEIVNSPMALLIGCERFLSECLFPMVQLLLLMMMMTMI